MKNNNVVLAIGVFCFIAYICLVLSVLDSLGRLNQEMKEIVYKHYGVPLK